MTGQSGANISDWMLGSLKKNPEGLLLLAAGAVLLMRNNNASPAPRYQAHDYAPGGRTPSSRTGFAQQAKEAASSVAASAADYASEAGQAIGTHSERIARSAQSTVQTSMTRILDEQPLMVAVAGLAAGAALAAAFPATALERRTLGPVGEQLSDAASRAGEQLKEATLKAGSTLKDAAEERGLSRDGLKEEVKEAATAFTETVSGKEQKAEADFRSAPFNPAHRGQE